ncbi:hypothetical protein BS47DRAFT_1368418 [Hydnum rufescens UP504]|uniref:Uncharacterized protein n=1 Tax=Hydnum rufescens UP504 TaxID=1448309 RepID=A0A9P6AFK6_9AGAM|nr:hypothetical protein BS47DRAFT_1368418 [Hydnum rufescens UP504]
MYAGCWADFDRVDSSGHQGWYHHYAVMMLKKYNKGSFGFPFCTAVHSGKELTYMTTHPLQQTSEEKRDSQLDCTKAACAKQNWVTSMHYNWPKFEYLGGMYVFIIYLYEACAAPNWAFFRAWKVPALSSILTSIWRRPKQVPSLYLKNAPTRLRTKYEGTHSHPGPKTQLSTTYRMTPATPALAGFLPLPNSPSEEHTDKARVKYGGTCSHPGPQPLCIPNPYNDESSTALHTCFGGCVAILGPFSLCETNPKNAQTTSTTKYGSAQPPKTPTRTLYDNKTSTAPHTHFGGDLHYVIPDLTNAQARLRAKHRSAQPPDCPTLKYPQPTRRQIKYGARHPLWRVFGTIR